MGTKKTKWGGWIVGGGIFQASTCLGYAGVDLNRARWGWPEIGSM